MVTAKKSSDGVVVELGGTAKKRSEKKWGVVTMKPGFLLLPSILLRAQKRLGLNPSHINLILHLCDHWWSEESVPWPKKQTIADRMGISAKQVQRLAKDLEERGYINREARMTHHGQTSNGYNLKGLVDALQKLAPEFISAAEAKERVEKPGNKIKRSAAS